MALVIRIRDPKNFACATLFTALSGLLAYNALSLPVGTLSEMGPGYFPLVLAVGLGLLGALLAVQSVRVEGAAPGRFEWRGLGLVTLALVAFGTTITRFGFIPAVVLTVGIAISASGEIRWRTAALLLLVLLAFCWAVFVRGLGLPVRLFGA